MAGGAYVLVGESEPDTGEQLRLQLAQWGYRAVRRQTTASCLSSARRLQPELVLMALGLNGPPDAIDAGRQITRELNRPVIFVATESDVPRLHHAGIHEAFRYLLRPYSLRELQVIVESALAAARLQRRHKAAFLAGAALDYVHDGAILLDSAGCITWVNASARQLLSAVADRLIGCPVAEALSLQRVRGHTINHLVSAALLGVKIQSGNNLYRVPASDGRTCYVSLCVDPLPPRNAHGGGAVLLIRDITEQYTAEQRLAQQEHLLRSTVRHIPMVLWCVDENGTFRLSEGRGLAGLGLAPGEVVGQSAFEIYAQNTAVTADIRRALAGETFTAIHQADGRIFETHLAPRWEDGRITGAVGISQDVTERLHDARARQESEQRFRTLVENAGDAILLYDLQGVVVDCNHEAARSLGYTRQELIGKTVFQIATGAKDSPRPAPVPGLGETRTVNSLHRRKDGSEFPVEVRLATINLHGSPHVMALARDVTERVRAEQEIRDEKERAETTLQCIGDGVITTDVYGTVDYMNPVAGHLVGVSAAEASRRPVAQLLKLVDEYSRMALPDPVVQCLAQDRQVFLGERTVLIRPDGGERAVRLTASPIHTAAGRRNGAVVAIQDVTALRQLDRQLTYQATHDALTGLINRHEFDARLDQALASAQVDAAEHALCYMDLDQFKIVNDTCGHLAGDELLRQIGQLLHAHVREHDVLARLGGDEFALLLHTCPLEQAERICTSIQTSLEDFRFSCDQKQFGVGISIGLVPLTAESASVGEVLAAADAACYIAKERGRNRVYVYRADDAALQRRVGEMERAGQIKTALATNRFRLYGQRIVAVRDPEAGNRCEILLRMVDDAGAVLEPENFLPAAERYRLMPAVDRWVVTHSLQFLADSGNPCKLSAAINLSGQSLSDRDFYEFILDSLTRYAIEPHRVCFEITETAAISNLPNATRFMRQLRDHGCCFSLDDFGSGLSSFTYLKTLPIDYLKIDGSFIRDMVRDRFDYAMVEAINQIGQLIGVHTVAEFVENDTILTQLRTLGVDYAQGFAIHIPEPLEHFPAG